MPPDDTNLEDNESTPLLFNTNTSAISSDDETDEAISSHSLSPETPRTRLASSYRRPSFVSGGGRGFLLSSDPVPDYALRDDEAFDCVREECGLLKRNSIEIPRTGRRRGSIVASAAEVEEVEETWEEAVKGGKIKTSWRYELGVMSRYSVSPTFPR